MGSIKKWPLLINDDDDDDDNDNANAVVNHEEDSTVTVQSQYSFYGVMKILGTYIGSAFIFGPYILVYFLLQ